MHRDRTSRPVIWKVPAMDRLSLRHLAMGAICAWACEICLSEAIRLLETLSVGRQRLQRLARRLLTGPKRKNVCEPNAPMRANATEREQANVHPPSHKRAGHSQNAGRVFRRDLRIISKHRHPIARGKVVEKVGQGWQGRRGKRDCLLCSIGAHKTDIGSRRRAQRCGSRRAAWSISWGQ